MVEFESEDELLERKFEKDETRLSRFGAFDLWDENGIGWKYEASAEFEGLFISPINEGGKVLQVPSSIEHLRFKVLTSI